MPKGYTTHKQIQELVDYCDEQYMQWVKDKQYDPAFAYAMKLRYGNCQDVLREFLNSKRFKNKK